MQTDISSMVDARKKASSSLVIDSMKLLPLQSSDIDKPDAPPLFMASLYGIGLSSDLDIFRMDKLNISNQQKSSLDSVGGKSNVLRESCKESETAVSWVWGVAIFLFVIIAAVMMQRFIFRK